MTVTVRFFAWHAESLGTSTLTLDLPEGATVADLVEAVRMGPGGSVLELQPAVAVNLSYAPRTTLLSDGDEVALIPPVAGG